MPHFTTECGSSVEFVVTVAVHVALAVDLKRHHRVTLFDKTGWASLNATRAAHLAQSSVAIVKIKSLFWFE